MAEYSRLGAEITGKFRVFYVLGCLYLGVSRRGQVLGGSDRFQSVLIRNLEGFECFHSTD